MQLVLLELLPMSAGRGAGAGTPEPGAAEEAVQSSHGVWRPGVDLLLLLLVGCWGLPHLRS